VITQFVISVPVPPHLVARKYVHVCDIFVTYVSQDPELTNVVDPKILFHQKYQAIYVFQFSSVVIQLAISIPDHHHLIVS
jgi:hypothetical protein